MRVLVTGSAGFIGRHVVEAARTAGHDVVGLDLVAGDPAERGDVRRAADVERAVAGVDAVVHLAGQVGLEREFSDSPDYVSHNCAGTCEVLIAAARVGARRLVLASSMVVYGEGRAHCPEHGLVRPGPRVQAALDAGHFEPPCPACGASLDPALVAENAPIDPRNVYAASKVMQEHLATAWARENRGRAALLRFHNVYGPGAPRDNPYSGVASIFLSAVLAGRAPQVTEDGRQRRDFVHVRDVARACVAALDPPVDDGSVRAYNIASGRARTVGEMATALASAAGSPAPQITGAARLGDVRHVTASAARAREDLGWEATEDFDAAIGELVARERLTP